MGQKKRVNLYRYIKPMMKDAKRKARIGES